MTTEQTPVEEIVQETTPESLEMEVNARTANFMDDSVEIILENGLKKIISYESFLDIVSTATNTLTENRSMAGFNLPSNVFYFASSSRELQVSCYYQSQIKPLLYRGGDRTVTKNILTPNIIISHRLRNTASKGEKAWEVYDSRYLCTNKRIGDLPKTFISEKSSGSSIFLLPMSNTYEDGRMCYGDNQMPRNMVENNLRSLDWYYQFLWETPFNNDLGIRACGTSDVSGWYNDLQALAEKEGSEFPYSKLSGFRG